MKVVVEKASYVRYRLDRHWYIEVNDGSPGEQEYWLGYSDFLMKKEILSLFGKESVTKHWGQDADSYIREETNSFIRWFSDCEETLDVKLEPLEDDFRWSE